MSEDYYGHPLYNTYLHELECSFVVYRVDDKLVEKGCVRLYVDITHNQLHTEVATIDFLSLLYTDREFKVMTEDREGVINNLKAHYLNRQILARNLDDYIH